MRYLVLSLMAVMFVTGGLLTRPASGADSAMPNAWSVDPVHSSIVWNIGHNNGAGLVWGRFNSFGGTIIADAQNPRNSSVEITVDAASVDTAVAKRDDHLRTPDFFNVVQFPTLSFVSTSVSPVDGADGEYEVTGDLTLLGVTKPVTLTIKHNAVVEDKDGGKITGFVGQFMIKRSDFGMSYGVPGIGDEINVMLAFECKPLAPTAPVQ